MLLLGSRHELEQPDLLVTHDWGVRSGILRGIVDNQGIREDAVRILHEVVSTVTPSTGARLH